MIAALIQLCSGPYGQASLDEAVARTAAAMQRADLVLLPESYAGFGGLEDRRPWAFDSSAPHHGRTVEPFIALSRDSDTAIVLGGTPELTGDGRTYNTALVVQEGRIVALYRKERLFDATLPDGSTLQESRHTAPGERHQDVVVNVAGWSVGLSICFDLRFPDHFARLRARGADVLVVPSAFTRLTGEAHWDVLSRARAIETQCFVLAPAQCGEHGGGRSSWGHSLAVTPWGDVLAEAGDTPETLVVELRRESLTQARARFGLRARTDV